MGLGSIVGSDSHYIYPPGIRTGSTQQHAVNIDTKQRVLQ